MYARMWEMLNVPKTTKAGWSPFITAAGQHCQTTTHQKVIITVIMVKSM